MREILTRNGLTVIEASNAKQAAEIGRRRSFRFDLLLTDVAMPETSGPELAGKLAQDWPSLNVLFMTGYADPCLLENGPQAAPALLRKPFSEDSPMQAVRAALKRSLPTQAG